MKGLSPGAATMTVLFTDLVDSTAMRSRLGDDKADALRREHDQLLTKVIGEHRGIVVKGTGDGLMAVFHAPSEGIAAASSINQAIGRRNRKARESLVLRMGMSVGEVRVEDDDVFGTPVVEAARLCGKAANDQILVSDYVRALAGSRSSAAHREVGLLDLKGLREPLLAFEVLWWEAADTGALPFPDIPALSRSTPYVGRRHELLGLADAYSKAALGRGPFMLVEADAGGGASRLAVEFALSQHQEGAVVLYGRCDPFGASAFDPFAEAIRGHVAHVADDRLVELMGPEGHHLVRLVPELAGRLPRSTEQPVSDPQLMATALFEAVTGWLNAASAVEPVVFVIDDLQWASRSTLVMLRHVLQRTEPMRVLVIATVTSGDAASGAFLADTIDELRSGPRGVERITLRAPNLDDLNGLVASSFGEGLGSDVIAAIADALEPIPTTSPLEAIWRLRTLGASPALSLGDGGWFLTGSLDDLAAVDLGLTVDQAVDAACRQLTDPARRVLLVAAVMGDELDSAVLAPVSGVEEADLGALLDEATVAGVLTELGGGRYRHTFTHSSVRNVIYAGLDPQLRRTTHSFVADELERQAGPGNTRVLAIVAHHRMAAASQASNDHPRHGRLEHDTASLGPADRVVSAGDASFAAGHWAREQLAVDEAAWWYGESLACLEASQVNDEARLADVLLALGEAQRIAGLPDARATLLRAADLARSSGDAEALARAALASLRDTVVGAGAPDPAEAEILTAALDRSDPAPSAIRARLLVALAVELAAAGDDRASERAGDAVDMARTLRDDRLLAAVLEQAIVAVTAPESYDQRATWADELAGTARQVSDVERAFGVAFVRSSVALEAGDLDTVQQCLGMARDAAARQRHPMLSWHLSIRESADAYARGDLDKAQRFAEGALELGQRAGRPETMSSFRPLLLAIRRLQGRLTELVPRLEQVFASDHAADAYSVARAMADAGRLDLAGSAYNAASAAGFGSLHGPNVAAELCNLAYLAAILGDADGAVELAERLAPLTSRHAVFVVPLHVGGHYLAMLSATRGEVAAAHASFEQAVRHHDSVAMPLLAAETRMEWARFCHAVRAPEHARQLAEQSLTLASHHRAHGLDAQARAFLSTLPPAIPATAVGAAS